MTTSPTDQNDNENKIIISTTYHIGIFLFDHTNMEEVWVTTNLKISLVKDAFKLNK